MARSLVRVSWTGNGEVERIDKIPITTEPAQKRFTVITFGPGRDVDTSLPDLKAGDRLEICAELEVTTDLTPRQARDNPTVKPAGVTYDYAPEVVAQLLLARGPEVVTASRGQGVALGGAQRMKLSHEQHHGVFVFDGAGDGSIFKLPAAGLSWDTASYVNLVLSASHPAAKSGNVLLVGQNEPDGSVEGDMGAICAIRYRPAKQTPPAPIIETHNRVTSLPLQGEVKRVVYSLALKELQANEQLRVRVDLDTSARSIGYPARLKTRVFLADSPAQLDPDGRAHANEVASSKGQITKGNGFNCLPGSASVRYSKVGVLRMVANAKRPLYLNVVAVAGDPEKRGRPDSVTVLPTGRVSVTRYSPAALG